MCCANGDGKVPSQAEVASVLEVFEIVELTWELWSEGNEEKEALLQD